GESERAILRSGVEDLERQVVVAGAELEIVVALLPGQEPREGLVHLIRRIDAPVRASARAVLERLVDQSRRERRLISFVEVARVAEEDILRSEEHTSELRSR